MAPKTKFENRHLADLHTLAQKAGIDGFRMLRRDDLVAALTKAGVSDEPVEDSTSAESPSRSAPREEGAAAAEPRRRRRRGGQGSNGDKPKAQPDSSRTDDRDDDEPDDPGVPTAGVIDITPRRHGFLRGPDLVRGEDDVYVSPAQIRRCELRPGDRVEGPARQPRRGERHPALVHVDKVEGGEPEAERPDFDELTPVPPTRRIELGAVTDGAGAAAVRTVDLLSPLALGQRVLILADARSGATTLIDTLAAVLSADKDLETHVLLIDERPEEVTGWRERHPDLAISAVPADRESAEQLRTARLVCERARRRVEAGADVVVIVDSLNRLAVAEDDVALVKRLFASGRETAEEGAGSLTVIAVAAPGGPGAAAEAVQGSENAQIRLDGDLAAAGIFPAMLPRDCRTAGEDGLRPDAELAAVRAIREQLVGLSVVEATKKVAELISGSDDNASLLS